MRYTKGGIAHMAAVIEDDLEGRETGLHKPHIKGLADLTASMLGCRSVNTSELLSVLPRQTKDADSRYRYINRWLKNPLIDPLQVMAGFMPDLLKMVASGGQTAVLAIDQSKISDGFECLMVSLRIGERAIPVAWKVEKTQGGIGLPGRFNRHDTTRKTSGMVPKKAARSLTSWFKTGLRLLLRAALAILPIPKLWKYANSVRW